MVYCPVLGSTIGKISINMSIMTLKNGLKLANQSDLSLVQMRLG